MPLNTKILIVDDNPVNVEILEEALGDEYSLRSAFSGEKALEIAPVFKPAVILLDIMMPGINGFEVCRRLRKMPEVQYAKIIMVSAKTMVEDRLKGYEAGADDYLAKPFNEDELKAKIRVYLQLRSAEEMKKTKSDMVTLISHEMRTPLNGIVGFADLLRDTELNDEQREYVDTIVKGSHDLLVFFAKTTILCDLQEDDWEITLTKEPLQQLIDYAIQTCGTQADEKNITFSKGIENGLTVPLNHDLLKRAITYVVENAVKFSPEGGTVFISSSSENGNCMLKVSDQGEGIAEEYLDKVFELFAIHDVAHHKKGQGLSLAIARMILEKHCGSLKASNNEDGGASINFVLPTN